MKPVELGPGRRIALNADASKGTIRVELLDDRGYRVRGFSAADAIPIHGDSLRQAVEWNGTSFDRLPSARYLIRIHLDNAEVFALDVTNP
jgi:hypothetical protein